MSLNIGLEKAIVSLESEKYDSIFYSLESDQKKDFMILVDQDYFVTGTFCKYKDTVWLYMGEGDPSEKLGKYCYPFFSMIIPAMVKDYAGNRKRVNLRFPKTGAKQLVSIASALDQKNRSTEGLLITVETFKNKSYIEYKITTENKFYKLPKEFDKNEWLKEFSNSIIQSSDPNDILTLLGKESIDSMESENEF